MAISFCKTNQPHYPQQKIKEKKTDKTKNNNCPYHIDNKRLANDSRIMSDWDNLTPTPNNHIFL